MIFTGLDGSKRVPVFPQPADHKMVRKTLKPQTVRQFWGFLMPSRQCLLPAICHWKARLIPRKSYLTVTGQAEMAVHGF